VRVEKSGEFRLIFLWFWLRKGYGNSEEHGPHDVFFLFHPLYRWQLGLGVIGLEFFECVFWRVWERMRECMSLFLFLIVTPFLLLTNMFLLFFLWYNHLFIGKIIFSFPPSCSSPSNNKKSFDPLFSVFAFLVLLSKYFLFFIFLIFLYFWKIQYQHRLNKIFQWFWNERVKNQTCWK
jgi:hypothetical protein